MHVRDLDISNCVRITCINNEITLFRNQNSVRLIGVLLMFIHEINTIYLISIYFLVTF